MLSQETSGTMKSEEQERAYRALRLVDWSQEAASNFLLYVTTGDEEYLHAVEDTAPTPEEG